ncbi:MAG: hypothetical protein ACOC3V_00435 [bacterium]
MIYNTYLFLEGKEDKYFIIQYNKVDDEDFHKYINKLKENELVDDIVENDYLNIIIKIPEELEPDYNYFVSGNFSKITKKKLIVDFLRKNYGSRQFKSIERIKQVLYKDKDLKEELEFTLDITLPPNCELSSIPDKQSETLKL